MTFPKIAGKRWLSVLFLVFVSVFLRTPALASTVNCNVTQPSSIVSVVGNGRAYFYYDADMCPGHKGYCATRAYVIAGDRVLTSVSQDGYTCVFMPGKDQTTVGWVETSRLRRQTFTSSPAASAWIGDWTSDGVMTIKVSSGKNGLFAKGAEDWHSGDGYNDDGTIGLPGRDHHAEFSGRLRVSGNTARLADGECRVKFTLIAEFLVVDDDNSCGDGDTLFAGVFRKAAGKPR